MMWPSPPESHGPTCCRGRGRASQDSMRTNEPKDSPVPMYPTVLRRVAYQFGDPSLVLKHSVTCGVRGVAVTEGPPGQGVKGSRWSQMVSTLRVRPGWLALGWAQGEPEGPRAPFTCVLQGASHVYVTLIWQLIWISECLIPFDVGEVRPKEFVTTENSE